MKDPDPGYIPLFEDFYPLNVSEEHCYLIRSLKMQCARTYADIYVSRHIQLIC